jgi:peptide/nickel transport system substrate-binding protein
VNKKHNALQKLLPLLIVVAVAITTVGCGPTPAPQVVEKVVTQTVKETVKETVIVEGTPQVVEKEVTKVVQEVVTAEVVVTATPEPTSETAGEVVLTVGAANQYGETFDIFNTATTMEPHVMIYEPLVTVDYNYQFQPGLATSWDVSDDGLVWTFHLQQGVTFHDGSPFNADVLKWWLEGMQQGVNSYMFESMTEAKVIDDYTIALTFSAPFPNLLYNLSTSFSGIMSKDAYEKYGDEYGTKYAVGTGPFMLQEWVQNDHLTLVKNPDYNWAPEWTGHKGPAQVDEIVFRIIPEDATRSIEFQSGNVQLLVDPPSPRELEQYRNDPNYNIAEGMDAMIEFIGMRIDFPLLKDIRTRQAIGYAIDRDLINETLYQGTGRPTTTYLSAELGGDKGVASVAPSYDPEKAKSLLAEVGWVPGEDGILVAQNVQDVEPGTRFEVSYWTYQEDEFQRLAEATQKMLADVGIKADVQLMDNPTYSAALKGGGIQLILRQYGWDNNDILEWFHHSKYLPYPNYLGVNDPTFDAMLDKANYNTALWADRDAQYIDIHKYLIENWYPWAPIRQKGMIYLTRSNVKSFKPIPLRGTSATTVWTEIFVEQ